MGELLGFGSLAIIAHGSAREKYCQQLLGVFIVVWLLAALFTKRTAYPRERSPTFALHVPDRDRLLISCFGLTVLPYPLNVHIIPHTSAILVAAAISMHRRSWLLFLGPGRSRTQLERLGNTERKSRIDRARARFGRLAIRSTPAYSPWSSQR